MINHLLAGHNKWEALAYNGLANATHVQVTPSKLEKYKAARVAKMERLPGVFTIQTVVDTFNVCRTRAESFVWYLHEDKQIEKVGKGPGRLMYYKKVRTSE